MKEKLLLTAAVGTATLFGASLALKNTEYVDGNSASGSSPTPTSRTIDSFGVETTQTPQDTYTVTPDAIASPYATKAIESPTPEVTEVTAETNIIDTLSLEPNGSLNTEADKNYFVSGDVVIDGINQFDEGEGSGETGLMVQISNQEHEIEAPYGATVLVLDKNLPDEEINNRIYETFDLGCENGCESVTLKFFGGEFDGQSVVIENGEAFTSESIEDNQTSEIDPTNEVTQTPEPTSTSLPEPTATPTLEVLSTITSTPTNEATQKPEPTADEEIKIEPVSTSQPEESTPVAQEEEIEPMTYSAIEAGSSEIVVGPALILGDVKITPNTSTEAIQIYDSVPETGSVALITSSESSVTVSAEWGADILKINSDISDPEVQSQIAEIIKTKIESEGCDTSDGNGCSQGMLLTIVSPEGISEQILINSENIGELEGLLK